MIVYSKYSEVATDTSCLVGTKETADACASTLFSPLFHVHPIHNLTDAERATATEATCVCCSKDLLQDGCVAVVVWSKCCLGMHFIIVNGSSPKTQSCLRKLAKRSYCIGGGHVVLQFKEQFVHIHDTPRIFP